MNRFERRVKAAKERKAPKRVCGPCQACCLVLGVPELGKLSGNPCPHACSVGCGVYQSRPGSCRVYRCLWLQGSFKAEHRPDLVGLVIDTNESGEIVVVREVNENDFAKPEAQSLVRSIKELTVYVVLCNGKRLVIRG